MSNDSVIDVRHLPQFLYSTPTRPAETPLLLKNPLVAATDFNLHDLESNAIRGALASAAGNRTHAAELLGISRRTLQRKLKELNI
jgi:two-component system response regulator AtoC